MTMRRATAAVSTVLLILVSVAVAEAALLVLLLLFSYILRLNFGVQLGEQYVQILFPAGAAPSVFVRTAGLVVSVLFTLGGGAGAAIWRYRRWRSA